MSLKNRFMAVEYYDKCTTEGRGNNFGFKLSKWLKRQDKTT